VHRMRAFKAAVIEVWIVGKRCRVVLYWLARCLCHRWKSFLLFLLTLTKSGFSSSLVSNLLPPMAHYYGIDRFAMDYWIASHPYVVPCDVSPLPDVKAWNQQNATKVEFEYAMYPRHDINAPWAHVTATHLERAVRYHRQRLKEYFLIPGYLYRWALLYNGERPPSDSWFWNWYPDGSLWREKARQQGNLAALGTT